jgi:hypothetical protein
MSMAQLTASPRRLAAYSVHRSATTRARVAPALGAGLLLVIGYAAFAHGGVALAVATRVQMAVAGLAMAGLVAWLWSGTLRLSAPRAATIAIGLLAAFGCWSGLSLLWSVAANQTWLEVNQIVSYLLVLGLAVAIGATYVRATELIGVGFLLVALAVTAYALGQKLFPGIHVSGLFDLNQTGPLPRLQEPLGYWNALALFIALGVPIALAVAADPSRGRRTRIAAVCSIELMVLAIVFTYSRGGLLALGIALAIGIGLGGNRLRAALWLAAAAVATLPVALIGLESPQLTTAGEQLPTREFAGGILAIFLILSLVALVAGARKLARVEPRVRIDPQRARHLRRRGLAGLAALVLIAIVTLSATGAASDAWRSFTATKAASNYDPHRLLSADSENRWVWWKEAAGAFSARPLAGWGAGSFGVVHLLYRHDTLTVQQPHSVPLEFLSDTGIVGGVLGIAAFVLLLRAATQVIRRKAPGPERMLAAGLLAGAFAYGVHSLYDWDWDIPAVTLPAMLFLGVLMGRPRPAPSRSAGRPAGLARWAVGSRAVGLAVLALWLAVLGLSIELPDLAAGRASSALIQASGTDPVALQRAQQSASAATALDPLSDSGPRAQALVALHDGDLPAARVYLQQAVQRQPSDPQAWAQLAYVDALGHHYPAAIQAAQAVVSLDPQGQRAGQLVRTLLLLAPPGQSATAIRTPIGSP